VESLDDEYPIRLTTGRRLESYNTGAQSNLYRSPLHAGGDAIMLSPEDAHHLELGEGDTARVFSRRGSVNAPVRIDRGLRRGLAFMTFHFPELVETNVLTIDATDPKSGTAEFKAAAIRVEKVTAATLAADGDGAKLASATNGAPGTGAPSNGAPGDGRRQAPDVRETEVVQPSGTGD
jgi:formate dehydrogenase major subunit